MKNRKIEIIVLIFFIVLVAILSVYILIPKIELIGKNKEIIEINKDYYDLGAKIKDKHISSTFDNLDISKIGSYKISYSTKFLFFTIKKDRIVEVTDKKLGSIEVNYNKKLTCKGKIFKDDKVIYKDANDKEVTKTIEKETIDNKVIYYMYDNNYRISKIININQEDKIAPELNLVGNNRINIKVGEKYQDPGVKIEDNCDDLTTNDIKIQGEVDSSKEGEYILTYTAKDSAGNESSVKRTVIVTKELVNNESYKKGVIYLTFDDGPDSVHTPKVLDILKEENIKAAFFITCNGPDSMVKRTFDEGHAIHMHTCTHNYATVYSSFENYLSDLKKVEDRIYRITNKKSRIIRFPGGTSNTISRHYSKGIMTRIVQYVNNNNYLYSDWNLSSGDAGEAKNSTQVYNNVTRNLSKQRHNVVLFHDIKQITVDALRAIIKFAKENNYTFEILDENSPLIHHRVNN